MPQKQQRAAGCAAQGGGDASKDATSRKESCQAVEGARGNGSRDPTPNARGTAAPPPGLEVAKFGHLCPNAGRGGRNEEEEESARGEREGLGDGPGANQRMAERTRSGMDCPREESIYVLKSQGRDGVQSISLMSLLCKVFKKIDSVFVSTWVGKQSPYLFIYSSNLYSRPSHQKQLWAMYNKHYFVVTD